MRITDGGCAIIVINRDVISSRLAQGDERVKKTAAI